MLIGKRIKDLRLKNGLTLEELANRTELSKGFLSQLERDKTTTSIHTFIDILDVLGTNPSDFFAQEDQEEKIVFQAEDCFEQDSDDFNLRWLVSNAQKNDMEPILISIKPKSQSNIILPFEGEAFGYVISGHVSLIYGSKKYRLRKDNSFYLKGNEIHYLQNTSSKEVKVLWVVSPPIF
ncbi:MAG: helix-turn-helix domain-containing protein [Bacilli bacterium]